MQVGSLGGKDPLEKGMATHSSILAWKIPWTEPGGLQSMGVAKSQTPLSACTCTDTHTQANIVYKCMDAHGKTFTKKLTIRFYPVSNKKSLSFLSRSNSVTFVAQAEDSPGLVGPEAYTVCEVHFIRKRIQTCKCKITLKSKVFSRSHSYTWVITYKWK